jgi:hypothetical protein
MFDFDPRDVDRDDHPYGLDQGLGSRSRSDPLDREEDWRPRTRRATEMMMRGRSIATLTTLQA